MFYRNFLLAAGLAELRAGQFQAAVEYIKICPERKRRAV